jgi:3-methyladenine DNA glycosylase AlkD
VGATDDGGWAPVAVTAARTALEPLADPARAVPMAAYMRDRFPFLGIPSPARRAALRAGWKGLPVPSAAELGAAATALWQLPGREYQYAACDLLERHVARRHGVRDPAALEGLLEGTVEQLITTRSWWDSVDALRSAAVGPLVAAHPGLVPVLERWLESDDHWLVRSAIIHQLGYRERTDATRLFAFCARRAADREFFVAKAVGWALRTYARQAPDDVRAFVAAHPELTPLARREALKHLGANVPEDLREDG